MKYNTTIHDSFRRTVRRILARFQLFGRNISRDQLRDLALNSSPESFFVTYDTAANVIAPLLLHCDPPEARTPRRKMWLEMARMVRQQMSPPKCLSFSDALSFVLNFRAPSRYYISNRTANTLIAREVIQKTILIPIQK